MVGKGVLYECLDNQKVETVLVISRESLKLTHPKLQEIIITDFLNLEEIKNDFAGFDACFFCLGISAYRKTEEEYTRITYDLTMGLAQMFLDQNSNSIFCYVSGAGTDENGRMMWARVKGKTENDLLAMSFKAAYMFRPGYIQPLKGIRSKTKLYNAFYFFLKPLYIILKIFPGLVTNTINVGKAMINVVDPGTDLSILNNKHRFSR